MILEEVVYKMGESANKSPSPTVGIVDSQSAKITAFGGFAIGYDAGKKVKKKAYFYRYSWQSVSGGSS